MHIKSPFPPIPSLPERNFHSVLFDQPPGNLTSRNHLQYIDALSGHSYTIAQFIEEVRDGATALAAPEREGGLGVRLDVGEHLVSDLGDTNAAQTPTRVPASRLSPSPKEIVAILSPNCLDYIILVHSCIALAVPFALIPSNSTSYELVYLLGKATPSRLFVHPSILHQALQAAEELKFPSERIYLLGTDTLKYASGRPDLVSLIHNVRRKKLPRHPIVQVRKDTLAYLVFSSGTGGRPKAAMVSHGNMQFAVVQLLSILQETLKLTPPQTQAPSPARWLCSLPFYHSYGLHFYMFRSFLVPSTCIIFPKWDINQTLEAIPKYKITHLSLVPSLVHQLVHSDKTAVTDVSTIQYVACGAAYLPPQLGQKMRKLFNTMGDMLEGYGLSECTVASMMQPPPGLCGMQPKPNSTGILLAGQEARIVREDGSEAGYNEPGELWLKGGHVVLGYYNDGQATRDTFTPDGWLKTGDCFRVDESGTFYFEDRIKDTLKISGTQVSPAEIEVVLLAHRDKLIIDATVAGVSPPSSSASQRTASLKDEKLPRAWIVLSPAGQRVGEVEVKTRLENWVKERLSKFKWLRGGIEVVDAIPKSPTGKVLRKVLQERHEKNKQAVAKL